VLSLQWRASYTKNRLRVHAVVAYFFTFQLLFTVLCQQNAPIAVQCVNPLFFTQVYKAMNRTLYQFPISHYCEKARWLLDFKQLDYSVKNLLPPTHRFFTQLKAQSTSVPLVRDDKEWITDSTELAFYLDAKYTLRPLLPSDPMLRSKAIMIESQADTVGEHVRCFIYSHLLSSNEVIPLLIGDGFVVKVFKKPLIRVLRLTMTRFYDISPENGANSLVKIQKAIDEFEKVLLQNKTGYLVGDCLTLADITVASIFAPLLSIKDTPWESIQTRTELLQKVYDDLLERPFGQWIMRVYAEERHAKGNWHGD
jgi:glutathione S-transferase